MNFSVGGTATFGVSPNDYTQTGATTFTPPTGTVTFGAGSSTATVTVDPETDTTIEADETVILTVTSGAGYNVSSPSSATGTITNDDADVSVAVAPAAVAEDGATNLVYTFYSHWIYCRRADGELLGWRYGHLWSIARRLHADRRDHLHHDSGTVTFHQAVRRQR